MHFSTSVLSVLCLVPWLSRLRSPSFFLLPVLVLALVALNAHAGQVLTPSLSSWQRLQEGPVVAWFMVGNLPVPGASWRPGLVVSCRASRVPRLEAYFGPFPADGRPVQFAVRRPDQSVERAGPVVRGGPGTGFHDPVVEDRLTVLRMARAILVSGSLVSNGYFSFWNGASAASNAQVLAEIERCAS